MARHTVLTHDGSDRPILPAQVVQIIARSQIDGVKPYRLYVDEVIARSFMIIDVRVGNRSMFPQSQRVPAAKFMHGQGAPFDCDELAVCTDFLIMVENIGSFAIPFVATWSCVVVPPKPRFLNKAQQAVLYDAWHQIVGHRPIGPVDANEDIGTRIDHVPERVRPRELTPMPVRKDPAGFGWDPYGDD